jgi:hypothetical protein
MTGRFSFQSKPHAGTVPELPDIAIWVRLRPNHMHQNSYAHSSSHNICLPLRHSRSRCLPQHRHNRFVSYWVHCMAFFWECAMKQEGSPLHSLASIS